ncbi:hypothetical protein [Glutamicibacter sp. NPDC087344]|uniref:hypothetical protein n=1 Tax=Glutamicibacter sp. NPDC087344 TaxID=3363994 RepID=UPI00382DDA99
MNGGTSAQATLKLSDPTVAEVAGLNDLYPGTRAVLIEYDGVIVDDGIIWDADYSEDSKTLTLSYESAVWSLIALRLISETRNETIAKWKKTYSSVGYTTLIKRLVQLATTGSARDIPIVFPADASGTKSRTYYGYNLDTAMEAIQELTDLSDGPDLDFRPRWTSNGTVEWVMRCGDLTASTVEINYSADDSGARGLGIKTSARDMATQVFAVGEGSGVDMLVRESQSSVISEYPQMERIEQFKNIKAGSQLYDAAASELVQRNGTTRALRCQLDLSSDAMSVSQLRPGMVLRWYIRNSPYFVAGWREWVVLKYSGSIAGPWVTLEFFEKGG